MKYELYQNRRDEYRAYLSTPLWQEKRLMAISNYGCVCARCGEHGTDVHHKTYERVGGNELLEDLEVLCRSCHDAHHALDKISTPKKKKRKRSRRGLPVKGAINYLNPKQMKKIKEEFGYTCLACAYDHDDNGHRIRDRMMEMLGLDYLFGLSVHCNSKRRSKWPAFQSKGGRVQKSNADKCW